MPQTPVIAIACVREHDHAIGQNNDLLFSIKADMEFFKEKTVGNAVIMGRKNWDSIPDNYRPLPDRKNVILSRSTDFQAGTKGVGVFSSLETALLYLVPNTDYKAVYIIGGGEVYREAIDKGLVDEIYLTIVEDSDGPPAEVFFHTDQSWENGFTMSEHLPRQLLKDRKSKRELYTRIVHYIKKQ